MTTDREALVEKVALAIQLADECEIPDDYSHGLDPNVSDWGAFLADAVINVIMEEAAQVADGFHPGSIIGREIAAALRAENERLNKSRNKWGQKYNKLLEKHKVTLSQLKTAVWSYSEECKLLTAENERLREALREYECHCPTSVCEWFPCGKTARAALEENNK